MRSTRIALGVLLPLVTGGACVALVGDYQVTGGTGGTSSPSGSSSASGTSSSTGSSSAGGTGGSSTCSDKMQDGSETGIDCGGPMCPPCTQGSGCKVGSDCTSGLFCVDSICCDTACGGDAGNSCVVCNVPDKPGTCTDLPAGADGAMCFDVVTCSGDGGCVVAGGAGHLGDLCSSDADCFNNTCQAGVCKLADGDPCAEGPACRTGRCLAGVCTTCATGTDCASDECGDAGTCLLRGGVPCATGADCASGSCTFDHYCVQQAPTPCILAECVTHFCVGGAGGNGSCASCMPGVACPVGPVCADTMCLAPTGAYCTNGADCASGMCFAGLLSLRKCE